MGLDNRAADRQSHPDPLCLGCKERFKDLTDLLRIEAASGILNLDQHTVGALCRLDEQLSRLIGEVAHGVDAIHDQINQDLLHLHPVGERTRQISGKVSAQGNTVSAQLIAQQPGDVLKTSFMSSSALSGAPFTSRVRIREITVLARVPSFTISAIASLNFATFCLPPVNSRKQKFPFVTIAARGWFTS